MQCTYSQLQVVFWTKATYSPTHTVVDGMQSKKFEHKIFCKITGLGVALTFQLVFLHFEKGCVDKRRFNKKC